MKDLKQQYLDEMKRLINSEYHDEIKIDELKGNFDRMSIEINKKKKLQQLEQVANLSTYPSKHFNSFCYDDDDDEDYTVVITPDFSITNSLIMENEHLDTISETESDEFIKTSVENLVLIPMMTSQVMRRIHEMSFKSYSNPLFDLDEEIISSEFNPIHNEDLDSTPKNDRFDTNSYLLESLLNCDESIPSGIDSDDSDSEGDNLFLERLLHGMDCAQFTKKQPKTGQYQHKNRNQKKKPDQKASCVETLVPIPRESEDFFDIENECDVPDCDDSQTTHFSTFSNPLFDDSTSSDDESSHEEVIHEISFKTYSSPLFDLDEEIISSEFNLIHNEDLDSTSKNDRFDTKSYLLESLLNRNKSIPPGIDSDNLDSEGDTLSLEILLHDDPIPLPDTLDFDFSNVVRFFLPFFTYPASPPDYELVSSEVIEIVIPEVGGIDDDILLTIKDDILHEKLLNVNLLIAKIEALNANPTSSSDCKTKSSSTSLNSLLEETNTSDNSLPEFETFCFGVEEISSGSTTTHPDISLPEYEAFHDDNVKEISSGSPTTHSDSSLYASFIFYLLINPFPLADRIDFYEFSDELIPFISPLEYDCFLFKVEPNSGDFTRDVVEDISPTKEPQVLNALPTQPTLQLNMKFQPSSEYLFTYVVWIFLPFLVYSVAPHYLLSLRNEDAIFDPDICNSCFSRLDVSHRCGTVKKFNTHRSHLNECPMMIHGQNNPPLDILLFHFYPL
uniref:Uncharacterized protein n=1 Tax=Tanacetum cinerariifolium TaxID=118510 RepID=A0A6L2N8A2_TANCI|nr:hypothetical protein [Tanacetum cinerariifolium]